MKDKADKNLEGKIFGRLKVLKRLPDKPATKHESKRDMWLCECLCDNHTVLEVSGKKLRNGIKQSCGCLQKEQSVKLGKNNAKKNTFDLSGEYGIGYSATGDIFYFDLEDYDRIKEHYWKKDGQGYICYRDPETEKLIKMHQFLLGVKGVDHINRKRNDNRKENLRKATEKENARNRGLQSNNTSGFTGVFKKINSKSISWYAYIKVNGKNIHLGSFKTIEEAIKTRLEAELKYFGKDYAPQRHLFKQYNID